MKNGLQIIKKNESMGKDLYKPKYGNSIYESDNYRQKKRIIIYIIL